MIEAVLSGTAGSWSPSSVLGGLGGMVDRIGDAGDDVADIGKFGGPASVFERALTEELLNAGHVGPFDSDFELQNGAMLSKAGEAHMAARLDQADGAALALADDDAAGAYRRVGFDHDAASRRLSQDGQDHAARTPYADDVDAAFQVADITGAHPTFRSDGSVLIADPVTEPIPYGRVFFNGDGRPIMLTASSSSVIDSADIDDPGEIDATTDGGDQMILPNGAVLAYDPWTAAIGGDLAPPA